MDDDARISRLLRDAAVHVDDLEAARAQVERRILLARRRSSVVRAAGLVAAAAAVLALVVIVDPFGLEVPVVGDRPAGVVRVSTACGEVEVEPATAEYLERWTEGRAEDFVDCVLAAVPGPEPRFDASELGTEQPWLSRPPAGITLPGPDVVREPAEGYPFVYIGTNPAQDVGSEPTAASLLRWWQTPSPGAVWWCAGQFPEGRAGCGPGHPGEYGLGYEDDGPLDIDMLVPDDTAVAVLSVGDEAVAWQRPRGRTVLFVHDGRAASYTVTAYDAEGRVIEETPIER